MNKEVLIIDTPGIFDTETDEEEVKKEIKRCVHLGAPGLHVILFVMEIGRFRQEDMKAIQKFLEFFEQEMRNRVIVVFTHGDKLIKKNQTLSEYLRSVPWPLEAFLSECDNRTILFNNDFNKEESCEQISGLLTMIEALKLVNDLNYYTDQLFKRAEERIEVREDQIREKIENEYRERQKEFERTSKLQIENYLREERLSELNALKEAYEEKLNNVREEVRREIADKDSKWCVEWFKLGISQYDN